MNTKKLLATSLTLVSLGAAASVLGQTTVYEQARIGGGTQANNPDFTLPGFSSTASSIHSSAPGLPAGVSTGSRFVATPTTNTTSFTVSPNHTTAGQLVVGTSYTVAITFGSSTTTGQKESTDIVVTTTDAQVGGNDTFAGATTAFQSGNGANAWINVGNVTVTGSLPTFTFTWFSGANTDRWYVDSLRFTPLPPSATPQYWDIGAPGGTGNWDTTSLNWNSQANGSGTQSAYTQADLSDFGGTAGTVTITDNINGITTDGGLEFDVNGYTITGGPLTLGQGTNIAAVGSNTTVTINSVINSANGMSTVGTGTVNLGAVDNISGPVTLSAGKLHFQPGASQTFTSLVGNGSLAIGANTLTVGDSTIFTYGGVLSDGGSASPGALIKQGTGAMQLGAVNTFVGKTTINQGQIIVSADGNLGAAPSTVIPDQLTLNGNGATLFASGVMTLSTKRGITLNGNNTLAAPHAIEVTLNGPITGSGSLNVPSAWPDFNVSNSFTGDLIFNLTNNISARFNASHSAGSGTIRIAPQTSSGTPFTLRNNGNAVITTLTNPIVIDESVSGGQSYNLDTGTNGSILTLSGNFSGHASGAINVNDNPNGQGTIVLSGNNSGYSGGFNLEGGTLSLGSPTCLGTGGMAVAVSATPNSLYKLQAGISLVGANAITNPIGFSVPGGFSIQGSNALELSGPITLGMGIAIEDENTAPTIFSGPINDLGGGFGLSLTSTNSSILELTGSNNYSGGTVVNSGVLVGGGTNSIQGTVFVYGGSLQVNTASAMSPATTLIVANSGTVNLNFTGYQTVASLNINNVQQGYGAYGAGTNNPNGIFTGTGTLVIAPAFAITSESLDATGTNLVVCWQSTPGVNYDVMTNLNLSAATSWSVVNGTPITASATTTCYTLPGGTANTNVFVIIRADNQ